MKKVLDIVMMMFAFAGTVLLVYSMFQPIKLWIPLALINVGAWMAIIRLFIRNKKNAEK